MYIVLNVCTILCVLVGSNPSVRQNCLISILKTKVQQYCSNGEDIVFAVIIIPVTSSTCVFNQMVTSEFREYACNFMGCFVQILIIFNNLHQNKGVICHL